MEEREWTCDISINYRTVALIDTDIPSSYNDWTSMHIKQGFSWRPGSISFRTLRPYEPVVAYPVIVQLARQFVVAPEYLRVIKVPFDVVTGQVELSSPMSNSWLIPIPPAHYAIYFSIAIGGTVETIYAGEPPDYTDVVYRLTFVPSEDPVMPEIMRADMELSPPDELLMSAVPA